MYIVFLTLYILFSFNISILYVRFINLLTNQLITVIILDRQNAVINIPLYTRNIAIKFKDIIRIRQKFSVKKKQVHCEYFLL